MAEWSKFAVGPLPKGSVWSTRCREFELVKHVTHVDSAIRIIEDGKLRPGLVFDKSKLNTRRILVNWLSPNHWHDGFRYGNVSLAFDFAQLIKGLNYYWVEDIAYNTAACRILITDQDRSAILAPYDPATDDGPWHFDKKSKTHYFQPEHCLEFMFEGDLNVENVVEIDFVQHHRQYCAVHRNDPSKCGQLGYIAAKGGAHFFREVAARGLSLASVHQHFIDAASGKLTNAARTGLSYVALGMDRANFAGRSADHASPLGVALARGVLNALANSNKEEALALSAQFRTEDALLETMAAILAEALQMNDYEKIFKAIADG